MQNSRVLAVCVALLTAVEPVLAGSLMTDYGFRLTGEPMKRPAISVELTKRPRNAGPIYTLWTVEDGVRRYHMPLRMADRDTIDETVSIGVEEFDFDARPAMVDAEPQAIGVVNQTVPFATRGGRELAISTDQGPKKIVQQVAKLRPDRIEVVSRNIFWEYGLLTEELDDASLLQVLDAATNPGSLSDMLSRVSFLVQAKRFDLARKEMASLQKRFPEAADRAGAFEKQLNEFYGQKILTELKHRQDAGQHRMVLESAKVLRDANEVSLETADRADVLVQEYEALIKKRDDIVFQLGQLEGQLEPEQAELVRPLRPALVTELHADTIDRLDSFLDSVDDIGLTADEKLALAYSAWVGGSANGTTNLEDAVDDWALRAAVQDFLRAGNEYDREARWPAINSIEGVTIEDLAAMIPLLPAIAPPEEVSDTALLSLSSEGGTSYQVQMPPEYSASHSYPVLVVLHAGAGFETSDELQWWTGTAEKPDLARNRGYIVVAPDYLGDAELPSGETHDQIMDVLVDVRRRFHVDSNRVFLAGHGVGADVVWDLGFARPLVWAGIVPIGGRISQAAKQCWENGAYTAIYAVNGGLDARTFQPNAATIQRLMEERSDVILCEYMSRGVEPFGAEKSRILDWCALHSRSPMPREIEAKVFHPSDTDWTWYHPVPIPQIQQPDGGSYASQVLSANITLSNTIYVGTQRATLRLSPELVDFEKRLRVKYGSRLLGAQLLKPSMRVMLDDFATRSDRQRLIWAELQVP